MYESIRHYMTRSPRTCRPGDSVFQARQRMQAAGIRHLPVVDGEAIVGMVTERDIRMLEGCGRATLDIEVRDAMTPEPYVVDLNWPVSKVCRTMAERKLGSVIVTEGTAVVGIFCTTDALRALAEILEEYFSAPTSDRYGGIISKGPLS